MKAVSTLRYGHLHTLRRGHKLQSDPTQSFLNARVEMTPLTSIDAVFRFSENGLPLQGKYEKPHRDVPASLPLPPWRDLSEEEALSAVMGG